jgi:iron-sulfur cluster assembly accessory protein
MTVTPAAREQLENRLSDGEFLQIGLTTGGCAGATLELIKVDSMSSTALNTEVANVIFADKTAQIYLQEGSLDFKDDLLSAHFLYKLPLGLESCGCGTSVKL